MRVVRHLFSHLQPKKITALTGGSFFGSPGFADLWRTLRGKPVYWAVQADSNFLAVLPGVEFGTGPFKRFQAMPDGCYGRLFFGDCDPSDKSEIVSLVMNRLADAGYMKCFLFDFHGCLNRHHRFRIKPCYTTLVDISHPDWEPPDKKLRQQIRKAAREGIHIEKYDARRHLRPFLKLVELSSRRIGQRCRYPESFFRALASLAEKDRRVRWIWCQHGGEPVSSNIFLVEGSTVLHWQAYFNEQFSYLQPSKYIPYTVARTLAQEGITCLNLGASPQDAPGVESFKNKWGGRRHHYNCYYRYSALGKLV